MIYLSLVISTQQAVGAEALRCLRCTSNLEDLSAADVVIEAIVESEDVKKKLFNELDKITKRSAILASNTSSISITRLASATTRPRQVMVIVVFFSFKIFRTSHPKKFTCITMTEL